MRVEQPTADLKVSSQQLVFCAINAAEGVILVATGARARRLRPYQDDLVMPGSSPR